MGEPTLREIVQPVLDSMRAVRIHLEQRLMPSDPNPFPKIRLVGHSGRATVGATTAGKPPLIHPEPPLFGPGNGRRPNDG